MMSALSGPSHLDRSTPIDTHDAVLAAWNGGDSKRAIARRLGITPGRVAWIIDRARRSGKPVCGHQPVIDILPSTRIADGMLCLFDAGFDTAEIAALCHTPQSEVVRLLDWRRDAARFAGTARMADHAVSA